MADAETSMPVGHGVKLTVFEPAVTRLFAGDWVQLYCDAYRIPERLLTENCVPTACIMFWLMPALGLVETFPSPHPPHVPLPSRQLVPLAVPVPNWLVGTSPAIKLAFEVSPRSTYCLVVAWSAAAGFAGSVIGPVIVPPAVGKKVP